MSARCNVLGVIGAAAISFVVAACAEQYGQYGGSRAIKDLQSDKPPTSTEMARGQCWMRFEKDKTAYNLDAKIKLVEQCIEEKKKQYPLIVR